MTDLEHARASTPLDDDEHFICCDDPGPDRAVALCGTPTTFSDDPVLAVECVVCTDLDAHDWCPRHGVCPYLKVD